MGGTPTTAKYTIYANIEIDGVVDKPDVIGAIFGQTEGLLGEDLDLRELQKSGRIGRIQVDMESKSGKSFGEVVIPSSLDRVETAIIAAAIETIDKVGPCTARVEIKKIEDVREEKRRKIIDRARDILIHWETEGAFEIKELSEEIMKSVRVHAIGKYGPDNLPCGPDVDKSDTVIVTEGRADVVNMLRHGYKNVIGMDGASVPDTIKELSKKKTIIAFVDGDRGGELILRELFQVADIDYVARAPPGKEVEDLTGKELAKYLRAKIPAEQYLLMMGEKKRDHTTEVEVKPKHSKVEEQAVSLPEPQKPEVAETPEKPEPEKPAPRLEIPESDLEKLRSLVNELQGSLEGVLTDENWEVKQKVAVRELAELLQSSESKPFAVIFDGVITQRLLDISNSKGVSYLVGARIGNIAKRPQNIKIMVFDDITK
ncbi:MAG: DNA primase [Candidatus Methanosuratincola subterraneus]|uniref:DNA primase DnaG n=1 Tax=Methanosuratincola subterraneus TaxID=2593994 RepID=A0A3S3TRX3_METS7|nr:MAG: DNA primase [Candidatus Methanosuratincola subterraneus]